MRLIDLDAERGYLLDGCYFIGCKHDIEPKQGEWKIHHDVKNIYGGIYIECSECGTKFVTQTLEDEHYCRNCGAKMKGENDE